jgi:hypothetical protein
MNGCGVELLLTRARSGSGTHETYGPDEVGSAFEEKPDIAAPFTEVRV